ncbi:MAG: glycosyltransferase family 2 protein [Selenomonadaceae bacterium]|nr:glycosyltransferase family 2 protein [Selenomonadaceae bacterium]
MGALLSIVVPVYGIERYLGRCIESIINQTYEELEIILVDDGSTDLCSELCDLYAEKDKRIRVIHKDNGGLVSARKAGLSIARGDYVGYVDGDDWVEPNFFQSLYTAMTETHADVVATGFSRDFFSKRLCISNAIDAGVYEGDALRDMFSKIMSFGTFFRYGLTSYVWNKLFKREELLPKQNAVDERITVGEDAAVVYPLVLESKRVCVIDNYEYRYRQRSSSMLKSKEDFKRAATRLRLLYMHLKSTTKNLPVEYETERQIAELMLGMYIVRAGGKLDSSDPKLSAFPFSEDIRGRRIIAYGAGTFGQQFMKRIAEDNACEIAAWVDDDYWEYRRYCMDVDPVDRISARDFDNVLILNLNPNFVEEARARIAACGVSEDKILTVTVTNETCRLALDEYLKVGAHGEEARLE